MFGQRRGVANKLLTAPENTDHHRWHTGAPVSSGCTACILSPERIERIERERETGTETETEPEREERWNPGSLLEGGVNPMEQIKTVAATFCVVFEGPCFTAYVVAVLKHDTSCDALKRSLNNS